MPPRQLVHRGVNYDTGLNFTPDALSREVWSQELLTHDMATIRHQLHCNAVNLYGSDMDRLLTSATVASTQGLHVWLQPRLIDGDPDETIQLLVAVAHQAERLRKASANITMIVGGEFSLTMRGFVPGASLDERVARAISSGLNHAALNRRVHEVLQTALAKTREVFRGPVTYASGSWEAVDWVGFDIVSSNLYLDASNRSSYLRDLRKLQQWGKPVAITEFGCCSYEGADRAGGMAFDVVDWTPPVPMLNRHLTRNEQVQADYLITLIRLYQAEHIFGAFVFTFSEPTNPYHPDAQFDLDMASYGLVKTFAPAAGYPPGHWEPKRAFRALAQLYHTPAKTDQDEVFWNVLPRKQKKLLGICQSLFWVPLLAQGLVPLVFKLTGSAAPSWFWFLALYLPAPLQWPVIVAMIALGSAMLYVAIQWPRNQRASSGIGQ